VNGDAARRYKELADGNTEAVQRIRERDKAAAEELRAKLAEADTALASAVERERVSRLSVRLHWESAAELLWAERWVEVGEQPTPTVPADVTREAAERADAEVGRTYDALRDALRKAGLLPRRRSS
jgi:hypothetical protein